MRHLCTKCNYIYDDIIGDKEENIEPGTEILICPVCEESDSFQGIEEEINYFNPDDNLTSLEIDHNINVDIKGNKMEVTIGDELHPMGLENRIAAISLHDEYGDLIKINYLELENEAVTEFEYENLDSFEIRAYCTVHGVWGRKFEN